MPGGNVGDFMRHDCGQLGFIIGREDQAAVHIEETAGQGECVDLIRLDDLDRERNLRIRVSNEVLADAVDILVDGRIFNKLHLALDFRSELASHLNFFLQREEIQTALVDVPVTDVLHIGILLFAFLLGFGFVLILILILGRRVGLVAVVVLGKQRHRNRDHEC